MNSLRITTSWDDGHPLDAKLAELLRKYGIGGTFYVPCKNREGRPVLHNSELLNIDQNFEIGGHTHDHVRLAKLNPNEAKQQIKDGKHYLEDVLSREVEGFCYPGGVHSRSVRALVRDAGFKYGRTIENFVLTRAADRFAMPTTLQFFPHNRGTYVRNFVRHRSFASRIVPFWSAVSGHSLVEIILALAQRASGSGVWLHFWGHSWEIEEYQLWNQLEETLKQLTEIYDVAPPQTNGDLFRAYFPESVT